jgi:hypothetical protein
MRVPAGGQLGAQRQEWLYRLMKIRAALVLVCLLAGCSRPPQVILPGKLDLAAASGDRLKLCPDDGMEDTTPDADCILSTAKDPVDPYATALQKLGWTHGGDDLLRWISPAAADGKQKCLAITTYTTNAARGEGEVVMFSAHEMSGDPGLACQRS